GQLGCAQYTQKTAHRRSCLSRFYHQHHSLELCIRKVSHGKRVQNRSNPGISFSSLLEATAIELPREFEQFLFVNAKNSGQCPDNRFIGKGQTLLNSIRKGRISLLAKPLVKLHGKSLHRKSARDPRFPDSIAKRRHTSPPSKLSSSELPHVSPRCEDAGEI